MCWPTLYRCLIILDTSLIMYELITVVDWQFILIIQIERLQSKYLYRRYKVHMDDMDARNPPHVQNERCLWHGTAASSVDNINTNGFNRSYCGQHGMLLPPAYEVRREVMFSELSVC